MVRASCVVFPCGYAAPSASVAIWLPKGRPLLLVASKVDAVVPC